VSFKRSGRQDIQTMALGPGQLPSRPPRRFEAFDVQEVLRPGKGALGQDEVVEPEDSNLDTPVRGDDAPLPGRSELQRGQRCQDVDPVWLEAPTTMYRASAADRAENRSLKSEFTGISSPHRSRLGHHVPGRSEAPLGTHGRPELEVE
jgi:hypothetical protein